MEIWYSRARTHNVMLWSHDAIEHTHYISFGICEDWGMSHECVEMNICWWAGYVYYSAIRICVWRRCLLAPSTYDSISTKSDEIGHRMPDPKCQHRVRRACKTTFHYVCVYCTGNCRTITSEQDWMCIYLPLLNVCRYLIKYSIQEYFWHPVFIKRQSVIHYIRCIMWLSYGRILRVCVK